MNHHTMKKRHQPRAHRTPKRRYELYDEDAALIVEALIVHRTTCMRFQEQTGQDFTQLVEQLARVAADLREQRDRKH
jgi:hypothetical protein